MAKRLFQTYGTRVEKLLGDARSLADLGLDFGGGFTEAELRYLKKEKWAFAAEDALWRRTKLGLHIDAASREQVEQWFEGCEAEGTLVSQQGTGAAAECL